MECNLQIQLQREEIMKGITYFSLALSLVFVLSRVVGEGNLSARNGVKNYIEKEQVKVMKIYSARKKV